MKKLFIILMAVVMGASFIGCNKKIEEKKNIKVDDKKNTKKEDVQIPNPWTEHKSLEEASKKVGFDISVPEEVKGIKEKTIESMDNEMIQISYIDGDKSVMIRKSKKSDKNNSGIYEEFKNKVSEKVGDIEVTFEGNEKVNLASWKTKDFSYSIYSNVGLEKDEMIELVQSVK